MLSEFSFLYIYQLDWNAYSDTNMYAESRTDKWIYGIFGGIGTDIQWWMAKQFEYGENR